MAEPVLLLGSGETYQANSPAGTAAALAQGASKATPEQEKHEQLRQEYSSWLYAPVSAALGVVEGAVPGAESAVLRGVQAVAPTAAQSAAGAIQGIEEGNPGSNLVGMAAGALNPFTKPLQGAGLVGRAVVGGIQAAAMTADQLAVEHLQTPEGSEKAGAALGLSFLFGAGITAAASPLMKWLTPGRVAAAGAKLEEAGAKKATSASILNNPGVVEKLQAQGADQTVADLAQRYDLLNKSPKAVRAELKTIQTSAEKTLNEIKAVSSEALPAAKQEAFAAEMEGLLKDTPLASKKLPGDVGGLQQLRIDIDRKINYADPSSPWSQRLTQARERVSRHIDDVLAANEGTTPLAQDLLPRWTQANADYAAVKQLQSALGVATPAEKSTLSKLGTRVAGFGTGAATFGAMGGNPGAALTGLGVAAAAKAVAVAGEPAVQGAVMQGVGRFMQEVDQYVVSTAVAGLKGGAVVGGHKLATLDDYQDLAATTTWTANNPTRAVPEMAQRMEEHGLPGAIIDSAVPQQIKNAQYLNSVAPKSPWTGKTVAPSHWKPTLGQQAKFVDTVNAVNNPFWALQNPTPARMAAVKATYPILYQRFAGMVAQEAATNPSMPLPARRWAASVTGLPATPGSDTQMAVGRGMYDAHQAMQRQAQAQGSSSRSSNKNAIVDSSTTRLGRMSE